MKKHVFKILIFSLILINCNGKSKSKTDIDVLIKTEITNNFKLEFLNQILSDSSETKLIYDKKELISNHPLLPPSFLSLDLENLTQSISHADFISETLNVFDVDFIEKQFAKNKQFDLSKISKFGFNVIDIRSYMESGVKLDSITKIAKKYYEKNNIKNYSRVFYITKPIFNKELNLAYIRIGHGPSGMTLIYERRNNTWNQKYKIDKWVE